MGIEVFNRYENKFLLDTATFEKVVERIRYYTEPDAYLKDHDFYTISNVYYDTADDYLISKSLSKPVYKEKLRLRAYGVPDPDGKVYLEIKKKVKGLVNKRRTQLRLKEAYTFVETGEMPELKPYMNKQLLNEITYLLSVYKPVPKVYLAYDRRAYFSRENPDLRITFDTNIRTRRTDLRLEHGDHGDILMDRDQWLMEIKAERALPMWLSRLLSEYKIFQTSYSKYGKEFENRITGSEKWKGVYIPCWISSSVQKQQAAQLL